MGETYVAGARRKLDWPVYFPAFYSNNHSDCVSSFGRFQSATDQHWVMCLNTSCVDTRADAALVKPLCSHSVKLTHYTNTRNSPLHIPDKTKASSCAQQTFTVAPYLLYVVLIVYLTLDKYYPYIYPQCQKASYLAVHHMMGTVWVEHRRKAVLFCQDTEQQEDVQRKEEDEEDKETWL